MSPTERHAMSSTMSPTTMTAMVRYSYGSPDRLRLDHVERPGIGDDDVRVRVRAAGLDQGVWHVVTGLPYGVRAAGFGLLRPKAAVPGMDVAGTVESVGRGVTRFHVGDQVFGTCPGSFAEYAATGQGCLALKPGNLTFAQAAVIPTSGFAALQGLRDTGRIRAGQHVLGIGTGGGVGSFAVQLAKSFGAQVTGVCSTGKVGLVRSIGADEVIDYTRDDFTAGPTRYDLILDTAGGRSLSRLRGVLRGGASSSSGPKGGDGGFRAQTDSCGPWPCPRSSRSGSARCSPHPAPTTWISSPTSQRPAGSRPWSTEPSRWRRCPRRSITCEPVASAARSPLTCSSVDVALGAETGQPRPDPTSHRLRGNPSCSPRRSHDAATTNPYVPEWPSCWRSAF